MKTKSIPYARQEISEVDIKAVLDVLRSDFLTQGPAVDRFEKAIEDFCGAQHAVAVVNATCALHLACLALDLKAGDSLWTSPNTFVASANAALYCGAKVDFVDIDPKTYNMSVAALETKLARAESEGKLPKIVVPVHFAGQSCDMEKISTLAKRYRFRVLEDASHAIGGRYRDRKIGDCRYSDLTVFSFHPVKIITSGEGGMITTNDPELYRKIVLLRSHGITRDPKHMRGNSDGPWYYQQIDLGFNYRLTDIQAALGQSQLERVEEFVERRHAIAAGYNAGLKDFPLTLPYQNHSCFSSYHLYVVRLKSGNHREVFENLHKAGILVNLHYIPVHLQPYYRELGFERGQFPEAEKYYSEAISLPMYAALERAEQDRVIRALGEVLA